jgi:hypothetical protein
MHSPSGAGRPLSSEGVLNSRTARQGLAMADQLNGTLESSLLLRVAPLLVRSVTATRTERTNQSKILSKFAAGEASSAKR